MYHPDAFLTIAHTREAELVREAQACGLPKKDEMENKAAWLPRQALAVALALVVLAGVLVMLIG